MDKLVFNGRILPLIIEVTVEFETDHDWPIYQLGITAHFHVSLKRSIITVSINTPKFEHRNMVHYYTRSLDLSRGLVDIAAFSMGRGLGVTIDSYVAPDGLVYNIILEDKTLIPLCTAYTSHNIKDIAPIVMSSPPVFMALNDLILSITLPHHAVVNCARAVDGIRHIVAPGDAKKNWPILRTRLNVDEAYLKLITDSSVQNRHGNRVHVDGPTTMEITRRAWVIMDRFFHYKLNSDQPLTEPKFPLLKG